MKVQIWKQPLIWVCQHYTCIKTCIISFKLFSHLFFLLFSAIYSICASLLWSAEGFQWPLKSVETGLVFVLQYQVFQYPRPNFLVTKWINIHTAWLFRRLAFNLCTPSGHDPAWLPGTNVRALFWQLFQTLTCWLEILVSIETSTDDLGQS